VPATPAGAAHLGRRLQRIDDIGPPADVYALGVILYEMLVGRPPLRGASTAETLELVRKKDPVPPRQLQPSVPFDLETICLKCLRKDPAQRYETAEELADDLKRYQAGRPILARPVGLVEQAWKFYRRNPIVVWTAAGVFALLLVATGAAVFAAVAATGEATALKDKAQAERDKGTAEVKKEEAEGQRAVAEEKLTLKESDLLIGVCERELHSNGDSALAERNLNLFPEKFRGWEWHYLKRRLDGERKPLAGHTGGLWSVAVHPDGTEVATASIDGTVRRWDVATGTSTTFDGHRSKTEAVVKVVKQTGTADAISGLKLLGQGVETSMSQLAGGVRPPMSVGDLPDPNKVPKHLTPVLRVAYSRDGKYVASGALDPNIDASALPGLVGRAVDGRNPESAKFVGRVLVWDKSGGVVADFAEHKTLVTALAFHPDGRHVASAGMEEGNAWKLWTWEGGKTRTVKSFPGHKGLLGQVRFNGDGTLAATGSTDGTAIVWDVTAGTPKWVFADHHATVHDLAFNADGRRLATAGMDGTVKVWDLTKPDPTKDPVTLRGHIGSALGVAFSPDGGRVASGGFDRTVRVWDPATGTEKVTLRGHTEAVWNVAFDKHSRLVSASFDGTARVWDPTATADDGRAIVRNLVSARSQEEADEDHRVNRLAYSRDGRRLATAGWDRSATLIDTANPTNTTALNHDGPVWGVAFSPTADRLVTGSWDTTVRVWDVATGKERPGANGGPFAKLTLPVQSVAYGHKGKLIAAATWDGTITVWNADTGKVQHMFTDHLLPVYDLAFSPDDTHLASAGGDRKAVVRSLTGNGKAEVTDHTATAYRVAFDQTGKRLAVASWDQTLTLWRFDAARTSLARVLSDVPFRHDDYVTGVTFSPDGKRLATVSHDKTLREWDAASGRPVGDPRTQRGVVWDVAYHPSGDRLAVAVWNPNGWVWEKPRAR
jgi:WD40 repeat protein